MFEYSEKYKLTFKKDALHIPDSCMYKVGFSVFKPEEGCWKWVYFKKLFDTFEEAQEFASANFKNIVNEEYRIEYKFQNISVFVIDTGKVFVVYKGIAQELGKEGKDLFDKAIKEYNKVVWENKLNDVFKELK